VAARGFEKRVFKGPTGFARKVLIGVLLCAVSVSSVPLWLRNCSKKQPQRHRGHRDCTEKLDFSWSYFQSKHLHHVVDATTLDPDCVSDTI